MKDNTSDVEQRVKRYWYVDGFGELVGGGGMCLILALYFAAGEYFGDQSFIGGLLSSTLALVLIGGFFLVRRIINTAKEHVTYPRTGYVEYPDAKRKIPSAIFAAIGGALLAAIFVSIVRRFDTVDAMVAISGIVMSLILSGKQIWSTRVSRFYLLSAAALIYGLVLAISGLPRGYNLGLFYGLMSISFALSGGLTLKRYLDENPLQAEL